MFDFDRLIERRGTHTSKWDSMATRGDVHAADAIPMWVADMDFAAPPGVTAALREEVERGVHGYYADTGSWVEALVGWLDRRHKLSIDPAWVSHTPGIVSGLGLTLQALTEPGDEVVLFPPVYHAFRRIIPSNGCKILDAGLVEENGRYRMDLTALAAKLSPRTRIVFLCSPHNPGGMTWSVEELRALALFCRDHDLILVSDEIHCDLVLPRAVHTPTITAAPEIADRLITCVAATKTFNLAGAHVGALYTTNPDLKRRIDARIAASSLRSANRFGMIATEAAWRTGDAWLDALLVYLDDNRRRFDAGIAEAVPGARSMRLDATYLAWVDFSATGLAPDDVADRIRDKARIFVSPGTQFGPGGETWQRFNFAMPRALLEEALSRLAEAFADLPAPAVSVAR